MSSNNTIHWLRIAALMIVMGFVANIAFAESELPVCQMIATGGTIAMKIDPVKNAPVPALSGEDLLASVPELAKLARVHVENLFNIPSDYMDPERWLVLQKSVEKALAKDEVAGVMITHGTLNSERFHPSRQFV